MGDQKDYYACLEVLPGAEDIVIRAACGALLNRYRRRGWTQDASLAYRRLTAINEAYEVLRNPQRRRAYDAVYRTGTGRSLEAGEAESVFDEALSELNSQWRWATERFPDLWPIRTRLRQTSHRLEFHFVVVLLEKKCFDDRVRMVAQLEDEFFASSGGKDRHFSGATSHRSLRAIADPEIDSPG